MRSRSNATTERLCRVITPVDDPLLNSIIAAIDGIKEDVDRGSSRTLAGVATSGGPGWVDHLAQRNDRSSIEHR